MSKLARKCVLSRKFKDNEVIVVDSIKINSSKTSDFIKFMESIGVFDKKILLLVESFQENLVLSSRNIRNVYIENVKGVSVYDLIDSEVIVFDKNGINSISEVLV